MKQRQIFSVTVCRIVSLLLALAVTTVCLAGCTTAYGEPYGKEEVVAEVSNIVASEDYELVSVKTISEKPADIEYTFRSTKRELTFTANSYLNPVYIDATKTPYYQKKISCSYVKEVHKLYSERVQAALAQYEGYDSKNGWITLLDFSDIRAAAEVLYAASEIYAEELEYHDEAFLRNNPVETVHAAWFPNQGAINAHEDWVNITSVSINGIFDEETYYDQLAYAYGRKVFTEKITDDSVIPEQYLTDDAQEVS